MRIAKIPTSVTNDARPYVEKFIEDALQKGGGRFNVDDVFEELASGESDLWMAVENEEPMAAVVTTVTEYRNGTCCSMDVCGGTHRKKWMDELKEEIEKDAKKRGCDWMEAPARPGWARVLKDYRKKFLILEKAL